MSESDDTDILLLIPPDLFTVASSRSSGSPANGYETENPIVSGLIEHVQLLQNRIDAIEDKDSNLLDRSLTKNSSFNGHKFDLPISENSDISRFYKSPSSSLKKCHSKGLLSPSRRISSSTLRSENNSDRKQNGMASQIYSEDKNEGFSSILNSKSTRSSDSRSFPVSDSKYESKETYLKPTTSIEKDPSSRNYSLLKNDGDKFIFTEPKSVLDKFIDKKNKIQEDHFQRSSSISEIDTFNLREYNYLINTQQTMSNPKKIDTESCEWKSRKLLSLTDFWEPDSSKSEAETLRIKLEEERFRREHCEKLIQELQKRLLEQQEKVAVAIGIDKEKNSIISEYQIILNKLKEQYQTLETHHKKLQINLAEENANHQVEIEELQKKIKNEESDKLKFTHLASEYKEKCEIAVKEKIEILKSHANELENYKSFVTTAENRYEVLKNDYDKLVEKNQEQEQSSAHTQQELYRERLKAGEIRTEMGVIHKALDTCEAELTVLRQEKENLKLKLKEEKDRCTILDQRKSTLLEELNHMRKNSDIAKEEAKSLVAQQEQIRSELRDIYQKQVEEVVKVKLKEFQAQLDAAETAFQMELDSKQRVIAECAARKIKNIIDKHQLEINLLEEKHKEEKCLYDIRVSQAMKKSSLLEAQLSAQQEAKSRVAEQLHSLMEKQWEQALQIISPEMRGNFETSNRNPPSREAKTTMKSTNGYSDMACSEPVKLRHLSSNKNCLYSHQEHDESFITITSTDHSPENKLSNSRDDLRKYIKMILQMQETKAFSGADVENDSSGSPVTCRQVPRKYYTKADAENICEKNVSWEPVERPNSIPDTVSVTQIDTRPSKPPWK